MVSLFALTQCCREETSLNASKSFPEEKQFVSPAKIFILEHLIDVWILLIKMRNRRGARIDP